MVSRVSLEAMVPEGVRIRDGRVPDAGAAAGAAAGSVDSESDR
jgi:hypothetical protein